MENWILNAAESSFLSRSSDPVSSCFITAARKALDGAEFAVRWRTRQQQLKQEKLISTPGPTN
ncbi:hypothetical protein DY984_16335 [Pseudomonas aeruginosa]|nr:hypothetical protein DY984_16335 [Pseudomonas aeruginosa]